MRQMKVLKSGFWIIASSALLLGVAPRSCNLTIPSPTPCGDFTFETPPNKYWPPAKPYPGPGRVTLGFNFKPENCGAAPCTCRKVVFVQAIKFVLSPYVPKQPNEEQTERMTHSQERFFDGWAIDALSGAVQPYYGMEDDGTFPFDPVTPDLYSATPGASGTQAVLRDSPFSSDWDSYEIQAISVPVCLDGASPCDHRILGYYTWSWAVPDHNQPDYTRFFHNPAATDLYVQAFDQAVQEWNNHLGNRRQPLQISRLP